MQFDTRYTILFSAAVCVVCSIFVAGAAVSLKDRQERNAAIDLQKKVLGLAGLMSPGESLPGDEVQRRFEENIIPLVVDLRTGQVDESVDVASFDQRAAAKDPATSRVAPRNDAKVLRLPNQGLVYQVKADGELRQVIVPVSGYGLWSTLYGFLALEPDLRTIGGITFYEHGETPGLGGEVDNPRWQSLWHGRKAYDESWDPVIQVSKGAVPPPERAPYRVDGLSGATITSRGVTHLVQFWLGDEGFGPYLSQFRAERGI